MNTYSPISSVFTAGRPNEHPSFLVGNADRTWGEFREAVHCSLRYLTGRAESRWLLNCEELYDFSVGFFSLLAAGKIVLIPPNFLAGTFRDLSSNYDAVLSTDSFSDQKGDSKLKELDTSDPEISRNAEIQIFTSGTTGESKKVVKKLGQLEDEISVLEKLFGEECGTAHVFGTVPHHHIYGLLFRILWPLAAGRTTVTRSNISPADLNIFNLRLGKSILVSSPAFLSRLHDLIDLSTYRDKIAPVFSSGGPLQEEDAKAIRMALGQAPIEIFGSTETGGVAWRRFGESADPTLLSSLPGVDVSRNDEGALTVKSPFTGGTKMVMGDGVEILEKGYFRLGHRLDRIVKVQEKRVSLAEVEQALREFPMVRDAVVIYQVGRRAYLGAAIVLSEPDDIKNRVNRMALIDQLKDHLAVRFEPAAVPRRWRFLENLPYDDRGKLAEDILSTLFKNKPDIYGDQG